MTALLLLLCSGFWGLQPIGAAETGSDGKGSESRVSDFVNHGSPAKVARSRGIVATQDGSGRNVIAAWISSASGMSLLLIDPETGKTEQFNPTPAILGGTKDFLLTDAGHFYAYGDSHLLVFDIRKRDWLAIRKGPPRFGYSFAESDEGKVYAGLQPQGHLVCFDPKSAELTDYGPLVESNLSVYPQSLAVDDKGWVYAAITGNRIVAFDPATRAKKEFRAEANEKELGVGYVFRGEDGAVYGRPGSEGIWHRYLSGEAEALDGKPTVAEKKRLSGRHDEAFLTFPDGQVVQEISIPGRQAKIVPKSSGKDNGETLEARTITFSYDCEGPLMTAITQGADGLIYGSTGHPRFLFSFDPETQSFRSSEMREGHLNAMTSQGKFIYGGLYANGELHQIDPVSPWDADGKNPKIVTRARNDRGMITRPYALLAHPDGKRVIMGGYYDRTGQAGGGLAIFDAETGESKLLSASALIEGHSAKSLCSLPDGNMLVGTTIGLRGRAKPVASEAAIYTLDMASYKVVGEPHFFPGVEGVLDLVALPEKGRVLGVTNTGAVFIYDASKAEVTSTVDLSQYGEIAGSQGARIAAVKPDGKVCILFRRNMVEFDPETLAHHSMGVPPEEITTGIILRKDRLYYIQRSNLWSCRLSR